MKKTNIVLGFLISFIMALPVYVHANDHKKTESTKEVEKQVKYRKAAFQMIKFHWKPLAAMAKAKAKAPYDAKAAKRNADAVAALSHYPINGFQVKGLTEKSTALLKIWDEWSEFENEMNQFKESTQILSTQTATLETFKPAFADVAKTCKSCHKAFREKK